MVLEPEPFVGTHEAYVYYNCVGGLRRARTGILLNQPPTCSITSPADGAAFAAPATIAIEADASDGDGTVAKVEFYQGATKLDEDTSSPYTHTWSNVAAGTYSLTAKATDNLGGTTTSAAVEITVSPAFVTVSGPEAAVFKGKQDVTIAWASNLAGDVTIRFTADAWTSSAPVAASTPNDGTEVWQLPNEDSAACAVRVSDAADGLPSGDSATFAIQAIVDDDDDRMDDAWEVDNFGSVEVSDGTADGDGDGASDLEEFWNGTDPNGQAGDDGGGDDGAWDDDASGCAAGAGSAGQAAALAALACALGALLRKPGSASARGAGR
jgi:hypothetical protein